MALRDIYEANKTTAKHQERAVVGTRQQQTEHRQRREGCGGSLTAFALISEKNSVLLSNKSSADSDETSVAVL